MSKYVKYCTACGKRLEFKRHSTLTYDKDTGKPVQAAYRMECPSLLSFNEHDFCNFTEKASVVVPGYKEWEEGVYGARQIQKKRTLLDWFVWK